MNSKIAYHLSAWFKNNARTLPWRTHPEPYAVWISEIMLQQTQVTAVLPYFERFMKAFPTVNHLAAASLDEVYRLWAGLGYYSRARNLHAGAQHIVALGRFPKNKAEWIEVPGVGEYTAGAVCSIALKLREPIVDGNVVRVLSRIYGVRKLDSKRTVIWNHARRLVEVESHRGHKISPDVLNQSLMELGALVCRPKNPACKDCPVAELCKGRSKPEHYPEPKPKKTFVHLNETRSVLMSNEKVFLVQNKKSAWREGLWDFPQVAKKAQFKLVQQFDLKYTVTNHKILRQHLVYEVKNVKKVKAAEGKWFSINQLPGVPAPVAKAIKNLNFGATRSKD